MRPPALPASRLAAPAAALSAVLLLLSAPLRAHELPEDVPPPPGCNPIGIELHDWDVAELRAPRADGKGFENVKPTGRRWACSWQCGGKIPFAAWSKALEAKGWRVFELSDQFLRAVKGDRILGSTAGMRLVEKGEPRAFAVPAPGKEPLELAADADVPWLPPIAGTSPQQREKVTGGILDVTQSKTGTTLLQPPFVRLRYAGRDTLSANEVGVIYDRALAAAGWEVLRSAEGGVSIARYSRDGRDLWVKLTPSNGSYMLEVADVGANESQARLARELEQRGHVALYGLYFDTGSPALRPESEGTLERVRALLAAAPALRVEVQGHTDDTGKSPGNQLLSEARAAAVRDWLVAHGIDGARLQAKGYADAKPVADNKTAEGRAKNRRVELVKLGAP